MREFRHLNGLAQRRQLESGVRDLVRYVIQVLSSRLGVSGSELAEYVLNQSSTWEVPAVEGDTLHLWLQSALNELDTAILGIVDVLDLPTDELADYLDQCLQSSYWQRRLLRGSEEDKQLQEQVIRGRAQWLWGHSNADNRKAFFAAGIGFKAGATIDSQLDVLGSLMQTSEDAILGNDIETAIAPITALAEVLLSIGPFEKENDLPGWADVLAEWLRGTALGACADNDGVAFIQGDVVYRLVWAVEATRLHLQHSQSQENPPGAILALCLTYGVPSRTAAVLMQGGIRSRTLATQLASQIGMTLDDMSELRAWVDTIRSGIIDSPQLHTEAEQAEWEHFVARFEHQHIARWQEIDEILPVRWNHAGPRPNTRVRIIREDGDPIAQVTDIRFAPLGELDVPRNIRSTHFFGIVDDDHDFLRVSFFGR
jgi:hypothetical protein